MTCLLTVRVAGTYLDEFHMKKKDPLIQHNTNNKLPLFVKLPKQFTCSDLSLT